jgi:hypothetical protein
MQPYRFYTPLPAAGAPAAEIKDWFFQRRVQVEALVKSYTPKSAFNNDGMNMVSKKLLRLESSIASGDMTAAAAVNNFQTWLNDSEDWGAWADYVADQQERDRAERARQQEEQQRAAIAAAKVRARDAARRLSGQYAGGLLSDRGTGRVIAGLAVVGAPAAVHQGVSGIDMHTHNNHLLIAPLLAGTHQAEAWPQASCAEVDALKSYLHAHVPAFNTLADIGNGGIPVFHAMVWHPGGKWQGKETSARWQDRAACANCDQWLDKIGALRA